MPSRLQRHREGTEIILIVDFHELSITRVLNSPLICGIDASQTLSLILALLPGKVSVALHGTESWRWRPEDTNAKVLLIPVLFADALLNLFWHLYYDKNHLKYVHRTQTLTDFYEELDFFIIAKNSH